MPVIVRISTCFFLFCNCFLYSQTYNFRNYSVEDGLPFVQVSSIYQDHNGFLWSGGYGGLSKFDGVSFKNYGTKDGLINNFVTCIAEDKQGNLWAGTVAGLCRMSNGKFVNYTIANGLAGNRINALCFSNTGILWIATNKGFSKFDGKTFQNYTSKDGLAADITLSVFQDSENTLWIGTTQGVSKLQNDTFQNISTKNGLCNNTVKAICQDLEGHIWLGTEKGVSQYDIKLNKFIYHTANVDLAEENISTLIKDKQNNICIGTAKGFARYDNKKVKHYLIGKEANSNIISCLFNDFENNIWLGTYNGLYRYRGANFITYNETDGLKNTFIYQMFRDKNNLLWVCTGDGFYKYDGKKFTALTQKDGLVNNSLHAAIQDKYGITWIATDNGISKFDGRKFTNYQKKDGLAETKYYAIYEDREGNIWMGGENGVTKFDGKKFANYTLEESNGSNLVSGIMQDSKGNLWFPVFQGDLYKYDGKNFINFSKQIGLVNKSNTAVLEDKQANIYMGTLDGVFMYDGRQIVQFSEKDGLNSDLVWLMTFSNDENDLWIGTNQGLNKLNLAEYKRSGKKIIEPYGKEEGFLGIECNTNATFHDADSSIWFGTVNGLVKYSPKDYEPNEQESKLTITSIQLSERDTVLTDGVQLPYNLNNISFQYIGISLSNPGKVRYQYKLEGYDKEWSLPSKFNFINYSNLSPGKYIFKVKSCNNEGIWNANPTTFHFTIAKPFWKKWWFWTIVSAATISLIVILFRYRLQQIKLKEQAVFQQKIQQSTNELKALRAQMNPHFIFNALNSIQNFIFTHDEDSASKYLNKFAKLIRTILSSSEKSDITIKEEMDALKLYLELEVMRFENKFEYNIEVDPGIDAEYYEIPTMLIQPYVENAIMHGLNPKQGTGKLEIKIRMDRSRIVCSITDNGIGRKKAMELKEKSSRKDYESMGMKITKDRLELINRIQNYNLSLVITDLVSPNGEAEGTRVEIFIPV